MNTIVSATIVGQGNPVINAVLEDGSFVKLFDYYDDELSFTPSEFVGLTVQQAHDLFRKKDVAYLQS